MRISSGGVPEWLKGADCKSVGDRLLWFESTILHQNDIGNDVVFFIFSPFHFRLFPVAIPAGRGKMEENGFHQMEINLFDYAAIWKKFR